VTRCGHLYCQSHLNHWLSSHPSCPVCKSLCTPAQDVVPIFSRGRTSPTLSPSSSPRSSLSPSPSPSPSPGSPTPTVLRRYSIPMPRGDIIQGEPFARLPLSEPASPLPTQPESSQDASPAPHPILTSYVLAHYLGLALRVLGLAILLAVLLR